MMNGAALINSETLEKSYFKMVYLNYNPGNMSGTQAGPDSGVRTFH